MSAVNPGDGKVKTAKEFVEVAYELTDAEAVEAFGICAQIDRKYRGRSYSTAQQRARILTEMEDETKTRLAAIDILATVVPGDEGPVIDIIGKLRTDNIHKYGFDHEQKEYEVKKATGRGEQFLGQRESVNSRKKRK